MGDINFCVSLVLVSLIYRAACPLFSETLHDHHISEESLRVRYSKLPVTGYLRTKGQESVYETCACVIHTSIVSHFTFNVCAGYMCFVKL